MAFVPVYGFETTLTAQTAAGAGQLEIDFSVAQNLAITLGGNYTYMALSDGLHYEIVLVNSVNAPYLLVTRAQSGTGTYAFPAGTCLRFIWNVEGITAITSTNALTFTGTGAVQITQTGPHSWTFNVPVPTIIGTSPIEVLGAYPSWDIASTAPTGCCCSGSSSSSSSGNITITGAGIVNVSGSYPNFVIGASGVNLIAGSGISITGTYPTYTISTTISLSTVVQSISGSSKILLSGPATNPTISLATTGVGSGTYNGITYDAYGTITAVNPSYVPVTNIVSTTPALQAIGAAGTYSLSISYATQTQPGLVQLAPPTVAGSNNSSDNTSAVTPAGINAILTTLNAGTVSASSNYAGGSPGIYTNALSSSVLVNLTGTQKALITAAVTINDATNPIPAWGFAVFNGATLLQALPPISSAQQVITFQLVAPFSGNLSLSTTALAASSTVVGQSISAVIVPS
jgi:hypothetical protein